MTGYLDVARLVRRGRTSYSIFALFLLAGNVFCGEAQAQRLINLTGGSPRLRVDLMNGLESMVSTESKILIQRQDVPVKVTVQTVCPGQSFTLSVRAVDLTAGASSGAVLLQDGMAPVDLIVNVPRGTRREQGTLRYTALATVQQGNSDEEGLDTHIVTYTLVQQ